MKSKNLKRFDKAPLFCVTALAMSISTAIAAEADKIKEEQDKIEVIEVTGYVGSLKKALLIKREANSIVDAIASEDLGKFPDSNVAESLQRITGVAIDRSGGEGNKVTVRGMGPEFNVVTLNGRELPNPDGSRSFSFDVLASEMISGAEVHKTSRAYLNDGGIGAVINVTTLKPLELDAGINAAASVKGMYDELTEKITPQFSGLVSHTNEAGTFGISASIAYQKRFSQEQEVSTSGWALREYDLDGNTKAELAAWAPKGMGYRVADEEKERISGLVVTQWAPTEDLTFTADVLYTEYEIKSDKNQIAHWWGNANTNNGGVGSAKIDEKGTMVYLAGHGASTEFVHSTGNRPTSTYMVGFNAEQFFNDDSVITFDASYAKSQNDAGGTQSYAVSGFQNTTASSSIYEMVPGDTVPSLTFPLYDEATGETTYVANHPDLTDPSKLANHFMVVEGDNNEDEIIDIKLDWQKPLEFGLLTSVRVGTFYNQRDFQRTRMRSADEVNNGTSTGFADDIPDNIGVLVQPANFLPNATGNFPTAWLATDNEALRAYYESDQFVKNGELYVDQVDADGNPLITIDYTTVIELANSPGVSEKRYGAFVDLELEGELGDRMWSANFGLRAVTTDQTSSGWGETILSIEPSPDDETISIVTKTDAIPITANNKYTNVLPSFNFKIEMIEDVDVIVAASQTITRPELGSIGVDAGINTRPGAFTISGGNPDLKPYKATNFDIAANWYFSESGYFGVSYMTKNIADYIVSASVPTIIAGEDFIETRPFNVEEVTIDGFEIATQYMFDFLPGAFSGLGVQVNYTVVDSDSSYRENVDGDKFGISGLSDTANFIGSYEYEDIQFRLSYNWRDKYLSNVANGEGEPEYVNAYGQWDMSGSYDINDKVSVFVEGVNITGESTRSYTRYESRFNNYYYHGKRFAAGVRVKF
ncbi:MAG: TonB-dependent receptor [Colwellia sp.]